MLKNNDTLSAKLWALLLLGAFVANAVSSFAADIFFTLIVLATVIDVPRSKSIAPFSVKNTFNFLIVVWVLSNIVGYVSSTPMNNDQITEILGLRWILTLYGCIYAGSKARIRGWWLTAAYALVSILIFSALFQRTHFEVQRFFGFYRNPNVFSLALIIPWSFMIGSLVLPEKRKWMSALNVISLFLLSEAIFLTYTRGVWISALVILVIATFLSKNKKYFYICITLVAAVIIMFEFNLLGFADRIRYSFDLSTGSSQSLRLTAWKVSWHIFLDHPWFGIGFFESYRLFPQYYQQMGFQNQLLLIHAHSQFLQILVGSGLFGIAAYLIFFAISLHYFYRAFQNRHDLVERKVALGAVLTILAFMVSSLTECPLMINEPRGFLLLMLGGSYGFLKARERKSL